MCDSCEWEDLLGQIEDLQDDKLYEFAADTLQGIYDWVENNGHCTENQRRAISNIEDAVG